MLMFLPTEKVEVKAEVKDLALQAFQCHCEGGERGASSVERRAWSVERHALSLNLEPWTVNREPWTVNLTKVDLPSKVVLTKTISG